MPRTASTKSGRGNEVNRKGRNGPPEKETSIILSLSWHCVEAAMAGLASRTVKEQLVPRRNTCAYECRQGWVDFTRRLGGQNGNA